MLISLDGISLIYILDLYSQLNNYKMSNLTRGAQALAKQYHKSNKSSIGITNGKLQTIDCYDKFLGHYTIQAYKIIGYKNKYTGKITML